LHKIALKEGDVVAELGCGSFGFFVFPVSKIIGKKGYLYAVDIIPTVLEEIKKKAYTENSTNIKTIWSNLEVFRGTKIESNSLDAALLINTLHQSDKKAEIIREATRMLKRGGKLLIVDFKSGSLLFGPDADKRIKADALRQASPKLGLTIIEEFQASDQHLGFLLKKM
jgi:ubiquinone/menaquinone biosynthesis C-methylase UbiE